MRKTGIIAGLILLLLSISGCGKDDEHLLKEPQWEKVDEDEKPANGEDGYADPVQGLIEDQSFEVELDGWGKVFFAAAAPSKDGETPHFMLLKDKEVVYTFPETLKSGEDKFVEVSAVAFQDYNKDGKKDVLVLVAYSDGQSSWNEPRIFLQENSDNMFYLDYPDLERYRVFQDIESDRVKEMAGKGELKKLETSFREGESQPDIIVTQMTVYTSFSREGMRDHFIVYDMLKDSPDSYFYRISSLSLQDDYVMETPLATQTVVYEGADYSAHITSQDCNGNELTEEEYDNFADIYYNGMGMTKKTAILEWLDVSSLEGVSDEEAEEMLQQAYDGFLLN